ncbi:MAG: hypothetical protein ACREI3_05935, partial [Nitrospirales bacterium]
MQDSTIEQAPATEPHREVAAAIEDLDRSFIEWRRRLAEARSRRELRTMVSHLFAAVLDRLDLPRPFEEAFCDKVHRFLVTNLDRRLSLRDLAGYLGYSEKYCSQLFHTAMGLTFSRYLKHLRLERASR